MIRHSEQKRKYDNYAAAYIKGKMCLEVFPINMIGRYPDLVTYEKKSDGKENVVRIFEVKSTKETWCTANYNDAENFQAHFPEGFQSWRKIIAKRIEQLYPRYNKKGNIELLPIRRLIRLYAITIACQLFRYSIEFTAKKEKYEKIIGTNIDGKIDIKNYLVIPAVNIYQLELSLKICEQMGYIIKTSEIVRDENIALTEITYPTPSNHVFS